MNLIFAGNYSQARLAKENVKGDSEIVSDVSTILGVESGPEVEVYFYGTYYDRPDFEQVIDLIRAKGWTRKNLLIKNGYWRGEL